MASEKIAQGVVHEVPPNIEEVIRKTPKIFDVWYGLTPIQRNEFICWVTIAKKDETKEKRLRIMIENLQEGKRNPCCWPGCPHRRESAKKWFQ